MEKERYRRMYELEKKEVLSDEEEDELKIESEIFMNDIIIIIKGILLMAKGQGH